MRSKVADSLVSFPEDDPPERLVTKSESATPHQATWRTRLPGFWISNFGLRISPGGGLRLREMTFRNLRLHKHFGRTKSSQPRFKVRRLRLRAHTWPPPPFGHLEASGRSKSKSHMPLHSKALPATRVAFGRDPSCFAGQGILKLCCEKSGSAQVSHLIPLYE